MRARGLIWMALVMVIGLCPFSWSGDTDLYKWAYSAPVKLESPANKGAIQFMMTPQVIDKCLPSLADLRVVATPGAEVGYLVRESRPKTERRTFPVKLYNRSFQPGQYSAVTLDFEGKHLKNALDIRTAGTNFRRKVRVEGCDDGQSWVVVCDGAFLFRSGEKEKKEQVLEKSVVKLPENDHRYLKVTVQHGPDDPEAVNIEEVRSWQQVDIPAQTEAVAVASAKTEEPKGVTEIHLDLGYRNMPLHALVLSFADRNFFRHAEVWGRNEEVRVITTVVEDSPKLEKSVPVGWSFITKETIYRFTTESGVDESLSIDLSGAKYRYLRVLVRNHSDPPLRFSGARVNRFVQQVLFAARGDTAYSVYCGNHSVQPPEYDVGRYIDRLIKDGTVVATLGEVGPNPIHKPLSRVVPWSERHGALIWIALVVMLAVLAFLVYRMALSAKASQTRGPS